MQLCCLDVNFKVCVIWQTFPGVFMEVFLWAWKYAWDYLFWVKIDSQNVQESFAFLPKDFTHLQYHTLYHTLKQWENRAAIPWRPLLSLSALCKTENGNQIKCLYLFSPHSILFGWINGIWMGKSPIKPLPTTILYTLRTMQ